jgi:hypothetical protein
MKISFHSETLGLKALMQMRKTVKAELTAVSKKRKKQDSIELRRLDGELITFLSSLNMAMFEKL